MAHRVFICHSSTDKAVADAACAALEAQRIPCWIAPRDILAGEEYGEAIIEALSSCQIVLLVFSNAANSSSQVRREIERALSKEKIIVPFRIERVMPSRAMEFALGNTHWLDALTPPLEHYLVQLCDTIARLIQKQAVEEAPLWQQPSPADNQAAFIPEPKSEEAKSKSFRLWFPNWVWGGLAAVALLSAFAGGRLHLRPASPLQPSQQAQAQPVSRSTPDPIPSISPAAAPSGPGPDPTAYSIRPADKPELLAITKQADQLYGQKRYEQAAALYNRACTAGSMNGCASLGYLFQLGEGVARDYARALDLDSKACKAASSFACGDLGELYSEGLGVAQNDPLAFSLESKACDAGDAYGCNNLGGRYRYGAGTSIDLDKARQYYARSCQLGVQYGCDRANELQ